MSEERPDPEKIDTEIPVEVHLGRIARELKTIRELVSAGVRYMHEAEQEVPEKIRRFMNYHHDVHDLKYIHEEHGVEVPPHILRELERLDDRFRQILSELTAEGGTFAKVRREMAEDPKNRWDHTKALPPPTHKKASST